MILQGGDVIGRVEAAAVAVIVEPAEILVVDEPLLGRRRLLALAEEILVEVAGRKAAEGGRVEQDRVLASFEILDPVGGVKVGEPEPVLAVAAPEPGTARVVPELVPAIVAIEAVVAFLAVDDIVAVAALDDVIAAGGRNQIGAALGEDVIVEVGDVGLAGEDEPRIDLLALVGADDIPSVRLIALFSTFNQPSVWVPSGLASNPSQPR